MTRNKSEQAKTVHVILGICMKTPSLTEMLEKAGIQSIAVIDYEAEVPKMRIADVDFYSPRAAIQHLKKAENVIFHKYLKKREV